MAKKTARKAPLKCPECGNSQDFWVTLAIKQSGQRKIVVTIRDYTGITCDKCEFSAPAIAFSEREWTGPISLEWEDKV
jgi:predicted nucleic-acid-binding Zn-ribbon protein